MVRPFWWKDIQKKMTTAASVPSGGLGRLSAPPFVGILAFIAVLGIVPLMHSVLGIVMDVFPERYDKPVSIGFGVIAVALLVYGSLSKSEAVGTWLGFIAAHLVWTGWIERAGDGRSMPAWLRGRSRPA